MFSMTIDDIDLTNIFVITDINRGLSPEIEYKEIVVPSMNGSRLHTPRLKARQIKVTFAMFGDIEQKSKLLQSVLLSNTSHKVIFSDKSDRYFEALLNGQISFDKITQEYATGAFELICEDPAAYSTKLYNKQSNKNKITIVNNGDYAIYPIYEFISSSNVTSISFVHETGEHMTIGNDRGEIIIQAGTTVLLDSKSGRITLGNNKQLWLTSNITRFAIKKGKYEIGIVVNACATVPNVVARFREVYAC